MANTLHCQIGFATFWSARNDRRIHHLGLRSWPASRGMVCLVDVEREEAMSELIERLAQECKLIGMRPHLDGIYAESLEAFAKAIARECAEIVVKDEYTPYSVDVIKERFGL